MFPDLTSDDIFRLETRRLWLRWPRAADAAAITGFAALAEVAQMTAAIPHPYPAGEAERFILKARADNSEGRGLTLALTHKNGTRGVLGLISASAGAPGEAELGYVLAPSTWGKGFASEAVAAMVGAVFALTATETIFANARVNNQASRRVLEKCGFVYIDSGLDMLPARGGLHPCDRFRLTRAAWQLGRAVKPMPKMVHQTQAAGHPAEFDLGPSAPGRLSLY